MLRAMDRRLHNEFATQAGLHGIKIPFKHNVEKLAEEPSVIQMNPEEEERFFQEAQARVKARFANRGRE